MQKHLAGMMTYLIFGVGFTTSFYGCDGKDQPPSPKLAHSSISVDSRNNSASRPSEPRFFEAAVGEYSCTEPSNPRMTDVRPMFNEPTYSYALYTDLDDWNKVDLAKRHAREVEFECPRYKAVCAGFIAKPISSRREGASRHIELNCEATEGIRIRLKEVSLSVTLLDGGGAKVVTGGLLRSQIVRRAIGLDPW